MLSPRWLIVPVGRPIRQTSRCVNRICYTVRGGWLTSPKSPSRYNLRSPSDKRDPSPEAEAEADASSPLVDRAGASTRLQNLSLY